MSYDVKKSLDLMCEVISGDLEWVTSFDEIDEIDEIKLEDIMNDENLPQCLIEQNS